MYFTVLSKKKFLSIISLIILTLFLCVSLYSIDAEQVFLGYANRELPIYRVKTEQNKIAISFDCAWGVDYTDKLLDIMQDENVKCTFFMVEFWTKKYPDYVKKINDYGHEIGTHSASHPYMSKLDKQTIIKELTSSSMEIEKIINKKIQVFRAPYGDYNDNVISTARELGLYTIQWDVDSLDWKDISAEQIANRVISKTKSGSIVLFHNQGKHTAEALPKIIKTLKQKGYEFVSIGDLIYKDNYVMGADGTQMLKS